MKRSVVQSLLLAGVCAGLAGCGGWEEESRYLERTVSRTQYTGADGYARVRVPLPEDFNTSKMLLRFTNLEEDQTVFVEEVLDDSGSSLRNLYADVQVNEIPTGAVAGQRINHFNWPIDEFDAPDPGLAGSEISVIVGAVLADGTTLSEGSQIEIEGILTEDADYSTGFLTVYLHWTAGLEQDPTLQADVRAAYAVMQDIFAEYGVTVNVIERTQEDDPLLAEGVIARPGFGSPQAWEDISASTDQLALDLVIVDTISGSDPAVLGAAGSIPGGILSSERSGVILSTSANAGPDLQYSESEIELFGTTMAHELGHMLGLFHPVELSYDRWDALDDTNKCEGVGACQANLGDNLMYPTALCSGDTCETQMALTANQQSVMHRYVGVDDDPRE